MIEPSGQIGSDIRFGNRKTVYVRNADCRLMTSLKSTIGAHGLRVAKQNTGICRRSTLGAIEPREEDDAAAFCQAISKQSTR
jgi:hypothetical protein